MADSRQATAALMVAGNWKMNTTVDEGVALARAVCASVAATDRVEIAVLPPFTHLWAIQSVLEGTGVRLGAQDVYWKDAGAFTGEISPAMLAGWCDLTLVGHSERRHIFGERDDEVGKKFVAALAHGLQVILAVGETSDERDDGRTFDVVDRQLDAVFAELAGPPAMGAWVIAYEPVWAIGTGRTATPEQAQEVVAHIKHHVRARFLDGSPRVLYGGSVTAANAASLFGEPDIDGALVGGVSLRAEEFGVIVAAAEAAARARDVT
jgi:triosephosphate isomerase (TIM)